MEQVDKYCMKYKKGNLALTLPRSTHEEITTRKNLFRHLIFDDERKLLFCFIPKVTFHMKPENSFESVFSLGVFQRAQCPLDLLVPWKPKLMCSACG